MIHSDFSRRNFLKSATAGFGYTAFAHLAAQEALRAKTFQNPLLPKQPHFEPKVKRVIFLFMQGAPTQHETFDYNPELEKHAGQKAEMNLSIGKQGGKILPPVYKFDRCGESGLPISEVFPHLQQHADDLCLLNGMHTDTPAHPQASIFTHTGNITFVRPSMGSWIVYGLGTENQDLPGFVTMNPPPVGGAALYGSAFLPATFQGTRLNIDPGEEPIGNIRNARMSLEAQRRQIDFVQDLNRGLLEKNEVDNQVEGVIQSYELAFKMQKAVPNVHGYFAGARACPRALRHRRQGDARLRRAVLVGPAHGRSRRALHRGSATAAGISTTSSASASRPTPRRPTSRSPP